MTDKALEAALKAADPLLFSDDAPTAHMAASPVRVDVARDLVRSRFKAAISAYLSALPGEAEVVAWAYPQGGHMGVTTNRQTACDAFPGIANPIPLVTLNSLQSLQARAEKAEAALAQLDGGSDHADDILAASAKFQCHECIAEEREFSCHDLEDMVIVEGKVVCKECVAEFYPKARAKPAPDIGKKLRRQRMFARQQQARAEAAEARVKELEEALSHALDHYDRNTCLHESVHRGGSIWTICDDCGRQWADDKGGFQPHADPTEISAARTALKGGSNG